jgi:hypothetical protein
MHHGGAQAVRRAVFTSAALFAMGGALVAHAGGIPSTGALVYAGQLDLGGGPANGPHDISISLWSDAVMPDAGVCSTAAPGLIVDAGVFSLVLSDACTQAVSQNPNLWFQVTVDGTSFEREAVGVMPFAVEAAHAPLSSMATTVGSAAANVTTQSDGLGSGNILFATTPPDLDGGSPVNYFQVTDFGMGVADPLGQNNGLLNCATQGTCTASSGRGAGVEFGAPGSGEGIASRRTTGFADSLGLDFYTNHSSRMRIQHDGGIVIPGTFAPAAISAGTITAGGTFDLGLTWITYPSPSSSTFVASCDGGIPVSGGAYIQGSNSTWFLLYESRPADPVLPGLPSPGWQVTCWNANSASTTPCDVAWVLCMDPTHAR